MVYQTSLDVCAVRSADCYGLNKNEAWSAEQMAAKLHTFRGEIAEGFFGKCVVVVEGVGDKAIIDAWFAVRGRDPHSEGIVVADANGKNNLGKPIIVFQELGIPCYWIFDNDRSDARKKASDKLRENIALQRIAAIPAEKCAEYPVGVFANFAAWDGNPEKYVKGVSGDKFDAATQLVAAEFDVLPSDCLKFPGSSAALLKKLNADGCKFNDLDAIVEAIDKMIMSG